MLRLADLLFLLRPTLLIPVWTFLFLGFHFGKMERTLGFTFLLPMSFWVIFVSYSLLMGFSYVLNQIWDRESDRINRKLFLLSEGIIPLSWAIGCLFLTLGVSFYLIRFIGGSYGLLWAISLILGILYSTPPFKFKGRPFLDLLSNAFGYGLINFLVGWSASSLIGSRSLIHSIPYIFAVAAVFLNTTVPDIPGDTLSGERTTGVLLGAKKTTLLSLFMMMAALISGLLLLDPFALGSSILALPFFLRAWLKPEDLPVKLSYRIGGGSLVLLVALRYPPFLVVALLTLLGLKVYYRRRFGLNYPSLRGR